MRMTLGLYMRPSPSAKRSSMTRCSSSSAAALLGAQIRMRGLAAIAGKSRSRAAFMWLFSICGNESLMNLEQHDDPCVT